MNMSTDFLPRMGASAFCWYDVISCLNSSGNSFKEWSASAGMRRARPVKGGESFSSRARWLTTAEMLPPAEVPPTMKPWEGSAPILLALAAA